MNATWKLPAACSSIEKLSFRSLLQRLLRHWRGHGPILGLLTLASFSPTWAVELQTLPLQRIALGSCADQALDQPIWDAIGRLEPQLFLFLGDNIYADTEDMAKMKADYAQLAAKPEFQRFRAQVPLMATWDDHDYGVNDGGAEYPKKAEAQQLFLDFLGEPADSPRRAQEGVYQAQIFGPPGQRVQVILLDTRTFRSPLLLDPSPYRRYQPDTDPHKTLLGSAQWAWLAEQLRQPSEFRFIVSSIRVLDYASSFECWKNLPLELERLFQLLRDSEAEGVVFLSGDAHFAQLKRSDGGLGYPLYEFTSSGLTHSLPIGAERPAPLAIVRPYGGLNFGTLEFDWEREDPELTLTTHDRDGNPVFQHKVRLSELRPWKVVVD